MSLTSVIIVNYNTFDVTCNCIDTVIRHTKGVPYEIILVDNASTECNADLFLQRFPGITLIKSKENGGFAKGNNLGILIAKGDIILLLNSDTLLTEDSISKAAYFLGKNANIGALTVRLVYEDGKYQSNARKFRSIRNELLDLARPVLKLIPYRKRAKLMLNQYFRGDFDTECDWVSGAFMMFHAYILKAFPGNKLDESFFMYGEDQLWCYQFHQLGYTNYFLSGTSVVHIANVSTLPGKQLKLLNTMLNRELYIMRHRRGTSLYYHIFRLIYWSKEKMRYYIKLMAAKVFGIHIR